MTKNFNIKFIFDSKNNVKHKKILNDNIVIIIREVFLYVCITWCEIFKVLNSTILPGEQERKKTTIHHVVLDFFSCSVK